MLWFLSSASNTERSLFWGNYGDVFIPGGNFVLHIEVSKICQLSVIFLKVYKQQDKVLHLLQEVYWQQDKWESLLDTTISWVFSKWKIKQNSCIETELLQTKNRNRKILRLSLYPWSTHGVVFEIERCYKWNLKNKCLLNFALI